MDSLNPPFDDIMERALDTHAVMNELAAPPQNWLWDGPSPGSCGSLIQSVEAQVVVLTDAGTAVTVAAGDLDLTLARLSGDAQLGVRLARIKFKELPVKLALFDDLVLDSTGRDVQSKYALDFEASWERADAAWIFKPAMTLASYTLRRESIPGKLKTLVAAEKNEQHDRAYLHSLAAALNTMSVDWYESATATFAPGTVSGQLVRTIPTTYDPNRPPARLEFSQHLSPAPSQVRLKWRAARGEHFFIAAQQPGTSTFDVILDNVTDTHWMGEGLAAGPWKFKGHAVNQFGAGPESEVVEITVPAVSAA